ncbi:hypothetical protein [Pseudodesulfovibrio sp.]|uniref:hypothetical protein n=1 Tax=unclassified Pseudodesulfovibrio TaxID=2661612 RepID=UPI003B00F462
MTSQGKFNASKLSTGMRINRAEEDPSALAVNPASTSGAGVPVDMLPLTEEIMELFPFIEEMRAQTSCASALGDDLQRLMATGRAALAKAQGYMAGTSDTAVMAKEDLEQSIRELRQISDEIREKAESCQVTYESDTNTAFLFYCIADRCLQTTALAEKIDEQLRPTVKEDSSPIREVVQAGTDELAASCGCSVKLDLLGDDE